MLWRLMRTKYASGSSAVKYMNFIKINVQVKVLLKVLVYIWKFFIFLENVFILQCANVLICKKKICSETACIFCLPWNAYNISFIGIFLFYFTYFLMNNFMLFYKVDINMKFVWTLYFSVSIILYWYVICLIINFNWSLDLWLCVCVCADDIISVIYYPVLLGVWQQASWRK